MADSNPTARDQTRQLGAWFLGPKAENAALVEEMVLHILRDYFHWRRNYYPSDEITITQHMRREFLDWNDALFQQLSEMLAGLRRHFPFYSPRYIAHMLSDQTIPSVLGYFAGMLYNPNNVTPEAAPVTVEWELDVARDILGMLGFQTPPPKGAPRRELLREFGWAHITSGGTVANIEALWAARNIRYFPLAVRSAARRLGLHLGVKLPGLSPQKPRPIADLDPRQCLGIRPNEAIYLLPRFVEAVKRHLGVGDAEAAERARAALRESGMEPRHGGMGRGFAECPPAIFVSGTAHYSLLKAADILGAGRDAVVLVDVDRSFRMDVRDLEDKLRRAIAAGRTPLAVVAIAGTTEEGAVDPVHRVAALRSRLEAETHQSFWLHIDAAWAGYIRSLFVDPPGAAPSAPRDEAGVVDDVMRFASRDVDLSRRSYTRRIRMQWGSREVFEAFLAFPQSESITVDPHKMGYVPYPCGVVAFRNDRVRR
ncbi:MAG: aspartate aminotransferase family protein, partial [Bryobacteraceae bacterium]